MGCSFYRDFELGSMTENQFQEHLRTCAECQTVNSQDEQILTLAKELNEPIRAPLLWGKIENAIKNEQERQGHRLPHHFHRHSYTLIRAAAALLLIIGVGSVALLLLPVDGPEGKLLTDAALQRVEQIEQEYIAAIEALEEQMVTNPAEAETDLMLLYRDRLETIDDQIERCKEALESNPANAHIRRYLLAALQDKRETLTEIVKYQNSIM